MKHYTSAKIIKNKKIAPQHFELVLKAPKIAKAAKPGNFIEIKVDNSLNPLLPRPMGIAGADVKKGTISVIYKVFGRGTDILSKRKINTSLMVAGPLGNFFEINDDGRNIALVAGGTGLGPILFYAVLTAVKKNIKTHLFMGAQSKNLLCKLDVFKKCCTNVFCSTDDGTADHKGFITDILEKKFKELNIDTIIAVGPTPMMMKAAKVGKKLKLTTLVSLEEKMACGIGICMGCAVKLSDEQYHMVCTDGPVFNAKNIIWE